MLILKIVVILVTIVVIVNLFFILAPQFGGRPDKERMSTLSVNSVYNGGRFHNRSDAPVMLPHSMGKVLKKQFERNPGRVPEAQIPSVLPEQEFSADSLSVVWLGHSTLLIHIEGKNILTDPVFGKRASPVGFIGPKPFSANVKLNETVLPKIDAVLISHDHFDHLDYSTINRMKDSVPLFLVPLGVRAHLLRWGVAPEKIREFDWGTSYDLSDSLRLTATPAQHFSGRRKQNNSTLWCSWVVAGKSAKVYFSGDSGYGKHFKEIGDTYGPFDLTLMECGAYGEYWPSIHMFPEESIRAHIDLKGKYYLPIHWGKYNLAFHPWQEPAQRMLSKAGEENVQVLTPVPGETLTIPVGEKTNRWWESMD